jgi:hypothetical protein
VIPRLKIPILTQVSPPLFKGPRTPKNRFYHPSTHLSKSGPKCHQNLDFDRFKPPKSDFWT